MSDVIIDNNELDYTEERDNMYDALDNVNRNRKRAIAGAATVLVGIAAGATWKARKKIKKFYKNEQRKHLNRRKNALAKEMAEVEARLTKFESIENKTTEK